jgi:hypothetical protein
MEHDDTTLELVGTLEEGSLETTTSQPTTHACPEQKPVEVHCSAAGI